MFLLTLSLMIGTAGLPHVIVRFFTVPKVADARSSAGWALVFIAILYTTAPAVGAMARLNLMETIQTGEVGAADGNLVYADRPSWFKNWETTGLLKFEDKNNDGRIQYYNDKNAEFAAQAAGYGWQGNEMVKVDRDIMVLANPEIARLPNWVIALVAAGGLAAALSTAAGLLLAISTAISHDVLKGMVAPDISEKKELLASRICNGGCDCCGRLPGHESTRICGTGSSAGIRVGGIFTVPRPDDGYLQQEDEPCRRYRRYADRLVINFALHFLVQGLVLRSRN